MSDSPAREASNTPAPHRPATPPPPQPDDGLRRLLTWTFIALGITLLLAAIGVSLAVYWFDRIPHP